MIRNIFLFFYKASHFPANKRLTESEFSESNFFSQFELRTDEYAITIFSDNLFRIDAYRCSRKRSRGKRGDYFSA